MVRELRPRFRKLRITASSVCGIACVLLIVLWVRSYWWREFVKHDHPSRDVGVESYRGEICFSTKAQYAPPSWLSFWLRGSEPITETTTPPQSTRGGKPIDTFLGFRWIRKQESLAIFLPHWFLVVTSAALATIPGINWSRRFSLRTLLIALTLVALALGIVTALR
jgi:hypothetical protein